jgi:hypothetical protein
LGPWAFREVFYPSSGPRGYLSPTAGVNALVVSMIASSTLTILLVLGVVAGAFATFGNSALAGGLKISSSITAFFSSGSLAAFSLASASCSSVSASSAAGAFAIQSGLPWAWQEQVVLLRQWKMSLRQALTMWPSQCISAGVLRP